MSAQGMLIALPISCVDLWKIIQNKGGVTEGEFHVVRAGDVKV